MFISYWDCGTSGWLKVHEFDSKKVNGLLKFEFFCDKISPPQKVF
jgi:hypothetical protein